jgi:hypothetical protein
LAVLQIFADKSRAMNKEQKTETKSSERLKNKEQRQLPQIQRLSLLITDYCITDF